MSDGRRFLTADEHNRRRRRLRAVLARTYQGRDEERDEPGAKPGATLPAWARPTVFLAVCPICRNPDRTLAVGSWWDEQASVRVVCWADGCELRQPLAPTDPLGRDAVDRLEDALGLTGPPRRGHVGAPILTTRLGARL